MFVLLFVAIALYFDLRSIGRVADQVGGTNTFFLILLSFFFGVWFLRHSGLRLLRSLQAELGAGRAPTRALLSGFLFVVAGGLFISPGFLSDFFAVLLIIPGLHGGWIWLIANRLQTKVFSKGAAFVWPSGASTHRSSQATDPLHSHPTEWRDVSPKVIDVTPIESRHSTVPPRSDPTND